MCKKDKQKTRLSRQLLALAVVLVINQTANAETQPVTATTEVKSPATFSSPLSYELYNVLVGEIYLRQGQVNQAALHYVAASQFSKSPEIAKRAAALAAQSDDKSLLKRGTERWVALDNNSSDALQYSAIENIRAEKYAEAAKQLLELQQKLDKEKSRGFDTVVALLTLEPQTTKAYATFKEYLKIAPTSADVQLVSASLAVGADYFEEALATAKKVRETGNTEEKEKATRLIAKALIGLRKTDEAVKELAVIAQNTKDATVKLEYARALILVDKNAEAVPLFKEVYAEQPDNTDVLYTLGLLYLEQKDYAAAEPLIKKLLTLPDRSADGYYFLGQLNEGQQKPKDALDAFQKAAVGGNFSNEAINKVVTLLQKEKGMAAAREWVKGQLPNATNAEQKVDLLLAEAQALHDAKQYKDALAVIEQASKILPTDFNMLYSRSLTRERVGDIAGAESDLRAVLKQQPENATVLNALGYLLTVNTDKFAEAEGMIRQAIEIRPNDAAIMDSMGWVLFKQGKKPESEAWLRKSYTQMKDPEVASHLVEVLSSVGKVDEAKHILKEMLVQYPEDPLLIKAKTVVGL